MNNNEQKLGQDTQQARTKRQHSRRHDDVKNSKRLNPFLVPFLLIFIFSIVEFYVGIWAKSLTLLSDAWHMFSDVIALLIAMVASYNASVKAKESQLSGHTSFEILASCLNAILMLIVVAWVVKEAFVRLENPQAVLSAYVMLVAFFGLVINLLVAQHLHRQAHHHGNQENLNHRAAFLHVLGDILGSVAALIAGAVIYFTGWLTIDPILSLVISVILLVGALRLIKDIWQTLQKNKCAILKYQYAWITSTSFNIDCKKCPRLSAFLSQVNTQYPQYFCKPVPAFGDAQAQFIIVGLAPGMHGANQTGRPFTGDHAGILLYNTLHQFGFANQPQSTTATDNLALINCRITNAVKCLPPENKPLPIEINTCNQYLAVELANLPKNSIVLALGTIAHNAVLKAMQLKLADYKFAHDAWHELANGQTLVDSYHCSRYNTQTKRLTEAMFHAVFAKIKARLA